MNRKLFKKDIIGDDVEGCEISSQSLSDEEKARIAKLEQLYLGKAIKIKHGWSVIKKITDVGRYKYDDKDSFWTEGDLIWMQDHNEKEWLKYRVRFGHGGHFLINDDNTLYEDIVDDDFENISNEIYDYAAEVNDQDGIQFGLHDSVVCMDNGKLKKCGVYDFNQETLIYTLKCYRTDEILYRKGPELLLTEYYGC